MTWIFAGVLLWTMVHFMPSLAPGFRQSLIGKLGEMPYKGLFALDIVVAIVLIVYGWRTTLPEIVYVPPAWGYRAALPLMAISVFLFGAARRPSAIKRILRHPQLTGLVVWSVAHLLANGDQKSLVLFGGLGAWALIQMTLINRREGEWVKPESPTLVREMIGVVVTAVVLFVLMYLHPYFAGVPLSAG
jgi:uncharacterized membrane protein